MNGFTEADVTDQSGKCFLITGANTGLGFEGARVLASRGARVLLGCRDETKAHDAIQRIRRLTPHADVVFLPLDLADLDSVRAAADRAAKEPRIDVLVNNAGVMLAPLVRTRQGFQPQFGVNTLGPFALTALLLPKLTETQGSRIVINSSLAHLAGKIHWDDLNAEKSYSRTQRYYESKLANLLFLFELDRRLRAIGSPVTAAGYHPGAAATELLRHAGALRILNPMMNLLMNTAAMGAWPLLQAATSDITPGAYYGPQGIGGTRGASGPASRSRQAQDERDARRLWDVMVEMTGVEPGLPPVECTEHRSNAQSKRAFEHPGSVDSGCSTQSLNVGVAKP